MELVTTGKGQELCSLLYQQLKAHGYYPALTGGLLYKEGERKDIDIVIFRNRQAVSSFEMVDIAPMLHKVGLTDLKFFGFVTKAKWGSIEVDLFNPETSLAEEY